MSFTSLTSIFAHKAHQRAIGAAQIVFEAQKVVGELGHVVKMVDGVLHIRVVSSTVASACDAHADELITAINARCRKTVVTRLKYIVGE